MKAKSKKKSLKGMTLVEIIIALAVLAVLTTVLVGTSNLINKYVKSANNVNDKVAVQTPVAEIGKTDKAYQIDPSGADNAVRITLNHDVIYEGDGYSLIDPTAPVDENELGGNIGLKFVDGVNLVP